MSLTNPAARTAEIEYPDSDGQPMAENTLQFQWIVTIKEGLEAAFRDRPDVFVAGDLLWYPVEGSPEIRTAPDAMVVFGRPKGYRGSYQQWKEGGLAPQVVFEVLSPGNRTGEMKRKREFYERFGVEEYYVYDPDNPRLTGWLRREDRLEPIDGMNGWVSPSLGIRFDLSGDELVILGPDGRPFLTYVELARERDVAQRQWAESEHRLVHAEHRRTEAERRWTEAEHRRTEAEHRRTEAERQRDTERERAERLAARLRELGIDPEG